MYEDIRHKLPRFATIVGPRKHIIFIIKDKRTLVYALFIDLIKTNLIVGSHKKKTICF